MKFYEGVTILVVGLATIWVGYGIVFESNVEQPRFKVLKKHSGFEVRQYDDIQLVAHTMKNENQSFRRLFQYIDGNNESNQKIPMTAPVIEQNNIMMFVMPDSMTSVPKPKDPSLEVKSMKNLTVAVKSFRGSANQALKQKEELLTQLKDSGYEITADWLLCQYNSPWVFPYLRQNEVWIVLRN